MMLTVTEVGSTCEVSSRLSGPPILNSLLGVTTQKPMGLPWPAPTQPCTLLSLLSSEYWYLSSTSPLNRGLAGSTSSTASP
jgi:hypothetical protein